MYMRPTDIVQKVLLSMLGKTCPVGMLFASLLDLSPGVFHELSCLISDPGAVCQPIHPDSSYSKYAPVWTVFVALQDVDVNMGGTVFIQGTNTEACHDQLKSDEKSAMLSDSVYKTALLRKGDCAVMDSRTFHFGGANESENSRRVLFYFTIRNPKHVGKYPDYGSLFEELEGRLTTMDYIL